MKRLQLIEKPEAYIYHFSDESELTSDYFSIIQHIQETSQPEISLLFFNGKPQIFKQATESLIDRIVQDYFVEYLKEDLDAFKREGRLPNNNVKGGLL